MTLTRRRLLTISAAFACAPSLARARTWQGRAFGGDISITLRGPRDVTEHALLEARNLIAQMEGLFSLYKTESALSRLNARGVDRAPDPHLIALLQACDTAWLATGGLFDPTVQPLWKALASGGDLVAARSAIGWDRVRVDASDIQLGAGQALTLNGIAQGYATDVVAGMLRYRGLTDVLVNIGEHRALGGPFRLELQDPEHGDLGTRTITESAIATSSPGAMLLGDQSHILHLAGAPQWSTVSVEAKTATLADALSTAFVLASRDFVSLVVADRLDVYRVTLVDSAGDLTTLT